MADEINTGAPCFSLEGQGPMKCQLSLTISILATAQSIEFSCMQGFGAGSKRSRGGEASEAAARARALMRDIAALPLDSMGPEQAAAQAQALYDSFLADAQRSPVLRALLEG